MRYKLLACALVLLIATPVWSQKFSPITVDTGIPTPSVVRSGESFKVTYRAKFFDTVLISEEQMQPDKIALEKIAVISLEVTKKRLNNDTLGFINVWDFTYTFRIIQPEKDLYKIPSFNFIWVEKKAGVTEDEAGKIIKPNEMSTEEVGVSYISSIVKPPPLDIRDEIVFVNPLPAGYRLRRWAYGVMVFAPLLVLSVLVIVFKFSKYSKVRQSQEVGQKESEIENTDGEVIIDTEPVLAPKKARKRFLREMKKLQSNIQLSKIRLMVRELLLAELRGIIRNSMTENEIYAKLSGLDARHKKQVGFKYVVMFDLARRLKNYQEDLDSGRHSLDLVKEIVELRTAVSGLKFYKRFLFFVKNLVSKRR